MDDQNLMENMLQLEKGVCDLFLHGTLESCTDNVHQTFQNALNEALTMQDAIYNKMAAKGWYPSDQAEQSKVTGLKLKFASK